MTTRRVLLFATTTGYQIRMFDDAARRLGIDLRLVSDRCQMLDDPWRDHAIAAQYHDLDASLHTLEQALSQQAIDGVLAVGDRPAVLAARAAWRFGVPWHSIAGAEASRHKVRTRERFRDAGLPVPWFAALEPGADPRALDSPFPCVVKPVMLAASRGVIRADNERELLAAVERVRRMLEAPDVRAMRDPDAGTVLIEGFILGQEFAVDGVLDHGTLHLVAIFDKPDPLDGPFFEETIYVTPSRAPAADQSAMHEAVAAACRALGLAHGPIHAECRVAAGSVHVLEVAARPIGGLCAGALRFTRHGGEPISLEELLLRHAARLPWQPWSRETSASGVMMIPIPASGRYRGVEGEAQALAVPGVTELRIAARIDQQLVPLPEGSSYLGFIFARAARPADVEAALRVAHAQLSFQIDRPVPVV
jgi:biotin carboxylase